MSPTITVVCFIFAYQAVFAAYSIPAQTEKLYDLAGSTGFVTSTLLSLTNATLPQFYPAMGTWFQPIQGLSKGDLPPASVWTHQRQYLASTLLLIWAIRLGFLLVGRIVRNGSDSRFDGLRDSAGIFAALWFGQALWITFVGLPVLLINAVPAAAHPDLNWTDILGVVVWAGGFVLEIIADREKSTWRKAREDKKHEEKFISSGLWSLSRHFNYVGEIILQCGPSIIVLSSPLSGGTKCLAFISPVFSYLLLRYVSGVPPLETAAERKLGDDPGWRKYCDETSLFVPWLFSKGKGKM